MRDPYVGDILTVTVRVYGTFEVTLQIRIIFVYDTVDSHRISRYVERWTAEHLIRPTNTTSSKYYLCNDIVVRKEGKKGQLM